MKFSPMAVWRIRASPGPGRVTSTSSQRSTSGPPVSWIRIALVIASLLDGPGIVRFPTTHHVLSAVRSRRRLLEKAEKVVRLPAPYYRKGYCQPLGAYRRASHEDSGHRRKRDRGVGFGSF